MLRLFVGIEFPPELKLHLSMLETGIAGAKWVDAGNFHLTLRFIGEVDEGVAADIDEALARVKARRFTLQLAGTGVFGGGKPRALWVGVERSPELGVRQHRFLGHRFSSAQFPARAVRTLFSFIGFIS